MNRLINNGVPPGGAENVKTRDGHDNSVNIKIFSRVNYKVTTDRNMYSEWTSLQETIQTEFNDLSVLKKFPATAGREVATAIVRHLAQNLGISSNSQCEPSELKEAKDVLWCMEVLSYGLGLPLSEHDTIRDSVNIYCEWLMALLKPKVCVPGPICEDPNLYARIIIKHFYSLFIPRSNSNTDAINRQAVLCHRVLRMLQKIARDSKVLVRETWDSMLLFLLAINDTLLAPPISKNDIGDQLCERIVSVLYEIWLLACAYCFPSPPLWKTFREMCEFWRHRSAVIDQWNRVNIMLTSKLLKFMYEPQFPEFKIAEEDLQLLPSVMSNDCIAQSWFRFLHLLGNPVELCYPVIISNTPKFLHYAITSTDVIDPSRHECLSALPHIFHKAMRGISVMVDAFLGTSQQSSLALHGSSHDGGKSSATSLQSITPPQHRKPAKSIGGIGGANKGGAKSSLISLASSKSSNVSQMTQSSISSFQPVIQFPLISSSVYVPRPVLAQSRPKCNSILHLFGAWLFEASLITYVEKPKRTSVTAQESKNRPGLPPIESGDGIVESTVQQYELGIAESVGALCRIFCAKKTEEGILPVYLARFYLAVQQGLRSSDTTGGHIMCSILMNSCDLLKLDLDGVMILVPDLIDAMEKVLPEREVSFRTNLSVPYVDLRRAAIHLLLSMLPLPMHFRTLHIKDLLGTTEKHPRNFQQYRGRLVKLLIVAIQSETDSVNIQMLLGGLLVTIQDSTACEDDHVSQDGFDFSSPLLFASKFDSFRSSNTSNYSSMDETEAFLEQYNNDSVGSLFEHALQLVCQRLVSLWKSDLNVSLAALEVLCGFAKIKWPDQDSQRSKRPVKWICDYIVYQCSRPPPFHSKDLHSNIVAAFHSVTVWLLEHPYLLKESDCLDIVMEVVELGISGSKSRCGPNEVSCMKGDKESKPASMRVRDAAESVLTYILERVGYFPSPCGQASVSSLLDEESLLCYCNSWNANQSSSREAAVKHFKYYVIDNSVIVALLEQPLGNDQDPQPTVTALIRGPFGRHSWALQLRHLARRKSGMKMHSINPGRPVPMNEIHPKHNFYPCYFPDSVDRIPLCNCDRSIPTLESVISDKSNSIDFNKMARLVEQQIIYEESVKKKSESDKNEYPNPETECKPPSVCQEFETARLFLSHFGFLSLESVKETVESKYPSLMSLNTCQPGFAAELEVLDSMSNRTYDTAFICYHKSGQKTAYDILSNVMSSRNVHPHFLEFLLSLGWAVNVNKHPGWTGQAATSWKVLDALPDPPEVKDHGGSLYNGQREVLYWSDATAEIAFVVPTIRQQRPKDSLHNSNYDHSPFDDSRQTSMPFERGSLERQSIPQSPICSQSDALKPRTLSLDLEKPILFKDKESPSDSRGRKIGRQGTAMGCNDTKVLIVWLESYEDRYNCPIGDLLLEMNTGFEASPFVSRSQEKDVAVMFIHLLQNGLFRVEIQGSGKVLTAIPLVNGMVVSRRVLGILVRQTALNICLRKRLENDCHYPPHLRRKLKVQDIVYRYCHPMTEPEFYTSLYTS